MIKFIVRFKVVKWVMKVINKEIGGNIISIIFLGNERIFFIVLELGKGYNFFL